MIEDGAFFRWPEQTPPPKEPTQEIKSESPFEDNFGQTVSGQEQLFDRSVGTPDSPAARQAAKLEKDTAIVAAATRQRVDKTSLGEKNRGGETQLPLITNDEPAMQPRHVPPPPKRPRGRTSNRAKARGDGARTNNIPFGEQ